GVRGAGDRFRRLADRPADRSLTGRRGTSDRSADEAGGHSARLAWLGHRRSGLDSPGRPALPPGGEALDRRRRVRRPAYPPFRPDGFFPIVDLTLRVRAFPHAEREVYDRR